MSFFSSALHTVAKAGGTAYDYLTPGKGSNRVTDWGNSTPSPKPSTGRPSSAPASSAGSSGDSALVDAQIKAANAASAAAARQNQLLEAQIAALPKLPYYNTTSAWAQAQKAAAGVINPVYTDKLNQYLQKENLGIKQQTTGEKQKETDIATQLQQALQDIATQRTRTQQDTTTQLGDVATNENNYQVNEAGQFNAARDALLGNISNSGLTTSGLGRQQETSAIAGRNLASSQQEKQFSNQVRDINTAASRTFEDLTTSQTRSQGTASTQTKEAKQALQDYIDNAKLDEKAFRSQNEYDRLQAIAGETTSQYQLGVQRFIASLIGSGARPQDIALAKSVYGIGG